MDNITRQLRGDEGARKTVYVDSLGFQTIAVGRLVDPRKPGSGLRDSEINLMLANDIDDRRAALLVALPWFKDLDEARQGVLLNMAFQLGAQGLLGFHDMLKAVGRGDYVAAAGEILASTYGKQTPLRAQRMFKQMSTGAWQFAEGA
jgi:lysozyme